MPTKLNTVPEGSERLVTEFPNVGPSRLRSMAVEWGKAQGRKSRRLRDEDRVAVEMLVREHTNYRAWASPTARYTAVLAVVEAFPWLEDAAHRFLAFHYINREKASEEQFEKWKVGMVVLFDDGGAWRAGMIEEKLPPRALLVKSPTGVEKKVLVSDIRAMRRKAGKKRAVAS